MHRRRKQSHLFFFLCFLLLFFFWGGGGGNVIYTAIAAICAACKNRCSLEGKILGGGPGSPCPPGSYA